MIKSINKDHLRVLQRIQESIPAEWLEVVVVKQPLAPTVTKIIELALVDPEVSDELKRKFQLIKETGYLDKEVEVEDVSVAQKIDEYVDGEIEKAIVRGELPKRLRASIKKFNKFKYGKKRKTV